MPEPSRRFDANSGGYGRFRPDYPGAMVTSLADRIAAIGAPARAMDVGCGTGIFTRQLARALPAGSRLFGIEPAARMRQEAQERSGELPIDYREGAAEALPGGDASFHAVTAATAAHWFDRPRFYAEASRVLRPGGLLAIVEYVRDVENSPAAAAIHEFLRREGGPQAYERPDYEDELASLASFHRVMADRENVTLHLDLEGFIGLALSSSHARACIARLGEAVARAELTRIGRRLSGSDGSIPHGYLFRMAVAYRC